MSEPPKDHVDEIAEALAAYHPGEEPISHELRDAIRVYLKSFQGRTIPDAKAKRLARLWNGPPN